MQSKREEGGEVWVLYCLTCPLHPTHNILKHHSLSLSNTAPTTTPKATTTLAFVAFCFCASYAIVYVCCFCSLFSLPSNGGGIIF